MIGLGEIWTQYEKSLLDPANAGAVQRRETRRAFYAGAQALLGLLMTELTPGIEPTDDDLKRLDSINDELKRFALDISEGKA